MQWGRNGRFRVTFMLENVLAEARAQARELDRFGDHPQLARRLTELCAAVEAAVGIDYLEWVGEAAIAARSQKTCSWWQRRFTRLAKQNLARVGGRGHEYRACLVAAFPVPQFEPEDGYVYAIRSALTGDVKIGFSCDPPARLLALQTATSEALELVGVVPGGRALERELHARFASWRKQGEWFAPSPDLDAWIASIRCAGSGYFVTSG